MSRMNKKETAIPIGDHIIAKIIGKKPRKPQTYELRKKRAEPQDLKFCEEFDKKMADWETKYEELRVKTLEDRKKQKEEEGELEIKEIPSIEPKYQNIYTDFIGFYKKIYKKDFNPDNPYSDTKEPLQYIYTLIFYFLRDKRFFDSPLLRKDLSEPSFEKGTLSIGGFGCGKTSTWNALLASFSNHVDYVKKQMPKNEKELLDMFEINKCISSDIVNKYNTTKEKSMIVELLRPLMSYKPLYIDDILREQDGSNFGKMNVFLSVLTHRADYNYKSHLSMNYLEKEINGKIVNADTEESLYQFRDRYDGRVHDRLFGMYNIIELTGKSFRR